MDTLTKARRSWNMSQIRLAHTDPELLVRRALHRLGFRFRLHQKSLPGYPDIVLPRHRTVIFVHGCFWHRHLGCRLAYTPKTRRKWWIKKLTPNRARDRKHARELTRLGWSVVVIWECEILEFANLVITIKTGLGISAISHNPTARA